MPISLTVTSSSIMKSNRPAGHRSLKPDPLFGKLDIYIVRKDKVHFFVPVISTIVLIRPISWAHAHAFLHATNWVIYDRMDELRLIKLGLRATNGL